MSELQLVYIGVTTVVFLLGAWVLYHLLINKKETKSQTPPEKPYTPPANFRVFNYFPNHSIRVDLLTRSVPVEQYPTTKEEPPGKYNQKTLIEKIPPRKTGGIPRSVVVSDLVEGNLFRIYVIDPKTGEQTEFADHLIRTTPWERIKNLHVGMVTTRFLGTTDTLRMSTTAGNAINGNAYLVIHNLSKIPLKLNDDIEVGPNNTTRYQGYRHQGITLGYYFKDPTGMYPDYQYLQPYSDIFYGVVSDIQQPVNGCWQTEYTDQCEYGQTLWPFREGVF